MIAIASVRQQQILISFGFKKKKKNFRVEKKL
jgi:hypothetical protein